MQYEALTTQERHSAWREGCIAVVQDDVRDCVEVAAGPAPSRLSMLFLADGHAGKVRKVYDLGVSRINAAKSCIRQ